MSLLLILTIGLAVITAVTLLESVSLLRARRWGGALAVTLLGLLLLSVTALAGAIQVGTQGYRALTHEVVAATILTERTGNRAFRATVQFPDRRIAIFDLVGDEFYVDAHILKWHPMLNVLGVHTEYELDRIAGRHSEIAEERSEPRTIFSLAEEKPVDMFRLARRFGFLKPLVDAEYGSATFAPAGRRTRYEVRVSTSGLLLRRVETTR